MAEVKIDSTRCKACKLCISVCPAKHLDFSLELSEIGLPYIKIKEGTHCIGCGFCFLICPDSCIEIDEESHSL